MFKDALGHLTRSILDPSTSLHLEPLGNQHAHVKIPLGTVGKAGRFSRAELASWSAGDAFVPARAC